MIASHRPAGPTVSVVVPTKNEAANLPDVLGRIPEHYEVVVVDGRSDDDSLGVARRTRPGATVLTQTRRGKGNALACGFAAATGDIIVMLDADGSADPAEIPAFVEALVQGADYAKGSRRAVGGGSDDITVIRSLGNRALTVLVNRMFRVRYTDLCYGYNAFWASLVPTFGLPDTESDAPADAMVWGDGFEVETLINIRTAAGGARITEVASVERNRMFGESNLNATSDGWRVLRTILTERRRLRRAPAVRTPEARPATVPAATVHTATPAASTRQGSIPSVTVRGGAPAAEQPASLQSVAR